MGTLIPNVSVNHVLNGILAIAMKNRQRKVRKNREKLNHKKKKQSQIQMGTTVFIRSRTDKPRPKTIDRFRMKSLRDRPGG
jgi:hypothetical protein